MADTAQYAGDDYAVRLHGLDPYERSLDFLPWSRVNSDWVYPDGQEPDVHEAKITHEPGTTLHDDAPLAARVEHHLHDYGTSVEDISHRLEDRVRSADPWMVSYGTGWYSHEAGSALERLQRRGYTRHVASHIIADLSPQNTWLGTPNRPELGNREESVRYGTECMKMMHGTGKYDGHQLHVTDSMAQEAAERFVSEKTGQSTSKLRPGKYDLSGHPSTWKISPAELSELPAFHSRAGRRERTNAIKACLGLRHKDEYGAKIGAFAHNIEHPFDSHRVTIDTHMADASVDGLTKATKTKFLGNKGGVRNEGKALGEYGGTTGGYGMIGIASATLAATKRLNRSPEKGWGRSKPDLLPMNTQAIVWTDHLANKKPSFNKHIDTMRTLPWDQVFGYNFGRPQAH